MKNVYATQAEHADRLMRLEQRQDGESRLKSAWGSQSPFQGLLNGTPQHEPNYNPAAEAFKIFDQDQSSSMLGSLHLDTEDEPRRGASRANSVRFDESAIHGQFGQGSRSTNDFYPLRTGSAFGSHPMTERSSSHKSDGRQSSAGQSNHSARASSIGVESRPLSATVPSFVPSSLPLGPPPGLFILGPVPSIIRCWLNTNFSNDSLLYAAVCTGSYKSTINSPLLSRLGYQDQVTRNREGQSVVKLPVYLPEATIQQSSSRSGSPAPQLPTLTTDFVVQDVRSQTDTIHVFLGCDVLRFRNADIHFSLDRLTLFDDERNKVSVPLVRPENTAMFQNLQVSVVGITLSDEEQPQTRQIIAPEDVTTSKQEMPPSKSEGHVEGIKQQSSRSVPSPAPSSPSVIGEGRKVLSDRNNADDAPTVVKMNTDIKDIEGLTNGSTPDTPTRTDSSNIWGSWRRDSTPGSRPDAISASASLTSGYQRAGRGRGMKVLKPARLNTSRTPSSQQPVGFDAAPSRFGDVHRTSNQSNNDSSMTTSDTRRSFSGEAKTPLSGKPRSANPIGGASAFGWLNSGSQKPSIANE
ncbi:MAG: hypothetical protein Q9217_000875 [Psora testacea]